MPGTAPLSVCGPGEGSLIFASAFSVASAPPARNFSTLLVPSTFTPRIFDAVLVPLIALIISSVRKSVFVVL